MKGVFLGAGCRRFFCADEEGLRAVPVEVAGATV